MRRRTISILAGLLLVSLAATPAVADRDIDNGNFPHYSFAYWFGIYYEQPLVREVPTGEWVELGAGWGTMTEEQRDHFLETVIVEIERDGVLQDFTPTLRIGDEGVFGIRFDLLIEPGAANSPQEWLMTWTFTEDHFDGWDTIPAGTVWEMPRTIVWTPRGQFPSGDYPPSEF